MLESNRMKGECLLIHREGKPGEKRENWLRRKVADRFAKEGEALVDQAVTSVATGLWRAKIDVGKPNVTAAPSKKGRKRIGKCPAFRNPQRTTLVDAALTRHAWMHEIRFDGDHALIAINGSKPPQIRQSYSLLIIRISSTSMSGQ
jgi:bifunctional non-homologous end joining protein LigD